MAIFACFMRLIQIRWPKFGAMGRPQNPGRRFAFGGIFGVFCLTPEGDPLLALEEAEVRYATKRPTGYKLAGGEGLHVLVRPNGSKLWRKKYRFAGNEKSLAFGA